MECPAVGRTVRNEPGRPLGGKGKEKAWHLGKVLEQLVEGRGGKGDGKKCAPALPLPEGRAGSSSCLTSSHCAHCPACPCPCSPSYGWAVGSHGMPVGNVSQQSLSVHCPVPKTESHACRAVHACLQVQRAIVPKMQRKILPTCLPLLPSLAYGITYVDGVAHIGMVGVCRREGKAMSFFCLAAKCCCCHAAAMPLSVSHIYGTAQTQNIWEVYIPPARCTAGN